MNVEQLIDLTDKAERTGQVDAFNPLRPWCECFTYACAQAIQREADPHKAAGLISEWLECQMAE